MPKKIDPVLRERAVRLVREHRAEYPSTAKAIAAVAHALNTRPRKALGWMIPAEGFNEQLLLLQQPGVATTN